MNVNSKLWGHLACFAAYAIFGVNIVLCKDLTSNDVITPMGIFTIRSLVAGLMFWCLSLFLPHERVDRRDYLRIFCASFLGFFVCQLCFLEGIHHITPMDCSIMGSMTPVYTMFVAAVAIKEPLSLKKCGGVVMSLVGVLYLIYTGTHTGRPGVSTKPYGVILMVGNTLSFALYLGIFKPLIQKYSVVTFMKWIFLFATVMSLPISAGELVRVDFGALPSTYVWELAFLVILATFVAYFLIPVGQKLIRPTLVSLYSYVQPIIAIAISIAVGMDVLTWQKVLAAVVVVGGVVMVSLSRARHHHAETSTPAKVG